jgi:deferrochelatase/peroxidase EfeB
VKQTTPTTAPRLALPDIQGLLLRGYKHFDFIRHLIFRIDNVQGVQALCQALLPEHGGPLVVTDSTTWKSTTVTPAYRLNIALTCTGLAKVIGPANYETVANASPTPFLIFDPGAVADAPNIGDVGSSGPTNWWPTPGWQLQTPPDLDNDFDMVLSLYARTPAGRESYCKTLLAMVPAGAATLVFQQDSDPLPEGPNVIHFGYEDGISQPRIEGAPSGTAASAAPGTPPGALLSLAAAAPGDDPDDRPIVPAWNFILVASTPPPPPGYNAHPFLVNGSFGAFRVLYQDVEQFNVLIASDPNPEKLAAKMCGRWRDGTPLEVSPDGPDPSLKGFDLTNFQYWERSTHQQGPPIPSYPVNGAAGEDTGDIGQACPYASHIRRSNPRDDLSVNGNAGGAANAVQHRVLRRARPYGPAYVQPDQADRGLVGYFIGALLSQQFSFVMSQWITANGFAQYDFSPAFPYGDGSGYDPLFGPSPEWPNTGAFQYCMDNANPQDLNSYTQVPAASPNNMPQLVITKGSLYVFFPSITALGLMAQGNITS